MEKLFLKKCANKFGTPIYIYDLKRISLSLNKLKKSLPNFSSIFYSIKANPNSSIISHLNRLNCEFEVSSVGEAVKVLRSGVNSKKILFTGPGKTKETINFILKKKIGLISIESMDEFINLKKICSKTKKSIFCLLRINPAADKINSSIQMMSTASQFGIDINEIGVNKSIFSESKYLKIKGFHFYVASNIFNYLELFRIFKNCLKTSKKLEELLNIRLSVLNLGGGFACYQGQNKNSPNYKKLKIMLTRLFDRTFTKKKLKQMKVCFESGRYIVGTCGGLICKVLEKKISKKEKFVVLDSGINHLSGMSGLGRLQRLNPDYLILNSNTKRVKEEINIVGPLCTPLDFWNRSFFYEKFKINDLIFVPNVSSYGLSASLVMFLSHDFPKEVIISGKKVMKVHSHNIKQIIK